MAIRRYNHWHSVAAVENTPTAIASPVAASNNGLVVVGTDATISAGSTRRMSSLNNSNGIAGGVYSYTGDSGGGGRRSFASMMRHIYTEPNNATGANSGDPTEGCCLLKTLISNMLAFAT